MNPSQKTLYYPNYSSYWTHTHCSKILFWFKTLDPNPVFNEFTMAISAGYTSRTTAAHFKITNHLILALC